MAKNVLGSNPFEDKKVRPGRSSVLLTRETAKKGSGAGDVRRIGLLEKGPTGRERASKTRARRARPDADKPKMAKASDRGTEAKSRGAAQGAKKPDKRPAETRSLKVVGTPPRRGRDAGAKRKQWTVKDFPVAERKVEVMEEAEAMVARPGEPALDAGETEIPGSEIGEKARARVKVEANALADSWLQLVRRYISLRFYVRRAVQLGLWNRSDEVDEFGLDPIFEERARPLFEFLYKTYWRVEATGLQNIPKTGRALLVANHSGVFPYDGSMISMAVRLEHPAHREVRPLVEDFVYHFPFLGAFVTRVGAIRACQENAERLLRQGALVAVFPEGIKGNVKYYRQRYQLQRFGRGGFIRLCMHTRTPIIPVAVVGAEEIHPVIARADWLGRLIGFPVLPITPTLPLLGPLGLVPLPSKWHIHFGKPINIGRYGSKAAEDHILVNRLTLKVREVIQEMIKDNLKKRRSPFFG